MNPNDPYGQQPIIPPQPQSLPGQVPQQPYGPTPTQTTSAAMPSDTNPYDFILSSDVKPKRPMAGGPKKLLIITVAISLVVVIGGLFVTAFAPSGSSKQALTTVAQDQQELIRIARDGEHLASQQNTKNLAYTIDLSIGTNQARLVAYMNAKGMKITEKQLVLSQDPNTDKTLKAAQSNSTYDSTLEKILADELTTYLTHLQEAYKASTNSNLKKILSDSFSAGKTLLTEAQQP